MTINDKTFYLIAGPNGSGKTTLSTELLLEDKKLYCLNADDIAREKKVSVIQAGRELLSELEGVFSRQQSFVLETTLSGNFHNGIISRAKANGYKLVFIYVILSSVEQNLARIRQRVAMGGHDVAPDIVRRRYAKSVLNFRSVCCQSDTWMLYYNGDKLFKMIARGAFEYCDILDQKMYDEFMRIRNTEFENNLLRLANRGALKARQSAVAAGVPVVCLASEKQR